MCLYLIQLTKQILNHFHPTILRSKSQAPRDRDDAVGPCILFIYSIYCTLSRFKKIITPLVKIYLFPSSICLQAANKSAVPEEYFFPMQLPRCQVLPTYVYFAFNLCLMRNKSVYNISGHIIKVYTTILPLQFTATIHYSFWRVRCLQGNR